MKLGILVNTERHLEHIIGITRAACDKGHYVIIFAMDEGTHLLRSPQFTELSKLDGVKMGLCRHSAEEHQIELEDLPDGITRGSQFDNAVMNHEADRVIVL